MGGSQRFNIQFAFLWGQLISPEQHLLLLYNCNSFLKVFYLFLMCWVFISAQAFSSCGDGELLAGRGVEVQSFSLWWLLWPSTGSGHVSVSSCGTGTQLLRSAEGLPRPGTALVCPAPRGPFPTTRPPEKPQNSVFLSLPSGKQAPLSAFISQAYFIHLFLCFLQSTLAPS